MLDVLSIIGIVLACIIVGINLLLTIAVVLTKYIVRRRFSKEQAKSISKWLDRAVVSGAVANQTEWLMFWPAWIFKRWGWFGWWLDKETDSADYKQYIGKKWTLWKEYNWNLRNAMWTWRRKYFSINIVRPPAEIGGNNYITVVDVPIDKLYQYVMFKNMMVKRYVSQTGIWIITAGLKYYTNDPNVDICQVNRGDQIYAKTSYFGEGMLWFYPGYGQDKVEDLMFRYSKCKFLQIKIFGVSLWKGYRTIKLGYGYPSYVLTVKHQGKKPIVF